MRTIHHEEHEVHEGEAGFTIQDLRVLCVLRGEKSRGEIHHEEHEVHEGEAGPIPHNLRGLRVLRGERIEV